MSKFAFADSSDDEGPHEWPINHSTQRIRKISQYMKKIDNLVRCGICRDIMDTVMMIPRCGHFFCSKCVTQHLFMAGENQKQCPECRKHTSTSELLYNSRIDNLCKTFSACRSSILKLVKSRGSDNAGSSDSSDDSDSSSDQSKGSSQDGKNELPKQKKMVNINYHMLKDKKLRSMVKSLNLPSSGKKEELVHLHKQYTMLHNIACSKSDRFDPATIVNEVKEEYKRKKTAKLFGMSKKKKKKGVIDDATALRKLIAATHQRKQANGNMKEYQGENERRCDQLHTSVSKKWRTLYSERVGKVFYFNTETKIGQFAKPDELIGCRGEAFGEGYLIYVEAPEKTEELKDPTSESKVTNAVTASTSSLRKIDQSSGCEKKNGPKNEGKNEKVTKKSPSPSHRKETEKLPKQTKKRSLPKASHEQTLSSSQVSSQDIEISSTWECPICTYLNQESFSVCEICRQGVAPKKKRRRSKRKNTKCK